AWEGSPIPSSSKRSLRPNRGERPFTRSIQVLRTEKEPATSGLAEGSLGARCWPVLLIVALTVAAYSNSFSGPFILDDIYSIVETPSIRRLWPLWPIFSPPPSSLTVVGRPLPNFTLAVNYAFGGLEMVGDYHAVNLIIHILAALTLYGVIRRTLLLPR